MSATDIADAGWLDTIAFAGASETEVRRLALSSRPGLLWYEHELAYVRLRVVRQAGVRPVLVFLPDGPATIESYDALVARLAPSFDLVLVEIPGFGYSYPKSPAALEFEETAAITTAAVESLGLPPAIWVGPCVQGLIAIAAARSRPDLVSGVCVLQTGDWATEARWGAEVLDPAGALRQPHVGQVLFRLNRERLAVDWWPRFAAGPDFDLTELQSQAKTMVRNHACYALASLVQKWLARADEPALRIDTPATVIWGLGDQSHAASDRRSILRYVPHARYIELERIGHFVDLESIETIASEAALLQRAIERRRA